MHLGSLGSTAVQTNGWQKAAASASSGCCVIVKAVDGLVLVGDSKTRRQPGYVAHFEPVVVLSAVAYEELRSEVADRDTGQPGVIVAHVEATVERLSNGTVTVTSTADKTTLEFLPEEWAAYVAAICSNELRHYDLVGATS